VMFVARISHSQLSAPRGRPNGARPAQPRVPVQNMATLKEVKIRLNSVKSIKKITGSMKLVAAAKLRVAQRTLEETRPFSGAVQEALKSAWKDVKREGKHLIVPVTSDRGLCGAVNSAIIKQIRKVLIAEGTEKKELSLIGEKAKAGLIRESGSLVSVSFKELAKKPPVVFIDILTIVDSLSQLKYDYMSIWYNKFVNVVTSVQTEILIGSRDYLVNKMDSGIYDYDDMNGEVLGNLYEFFLACALYTAVSEQATAEVGSRMTAMDNASKNAGAMINSLTLQYNRRRQAAITTELCEIIGGAESLNDEIVAEELKKRAAQAAAPVEDDAPW